MEGKLIERGSKRQRLLSRKAGQVDEECGCSGEKMKKREGKKWRMVPEREMEMTWSDFMIQISIL